MKHWKINLWINNQCINTEFSRSLASKAPLPIRFQSQNDLFSVMFEWFKCLCDPVMIQSTIQSSETREDGTSAWQADLKIHEIHIFFPSSAEHITAVSGTNKNTKEPHEDPPNALMSLPDNQLLQLHYINSDKHHLNTEAAVIGCFSCQSDSLFLSKQAVLDQNTASDNKNWY